MLGTGGRLGMCIATCFSRIDIDGSCALAVQCAMPTTFEAESRQNYNDAGVCGEYLISVADIHFLPPERTA
jgi:hypothetical protein